MIVYEDDEVYVCFRPGPSADLLVTFNNVNTVKPSGPYWGQSIADRANLACLAIMAKRPNWFPAASMARAAEAVAPLTAPYGTRIGYGSSMGAYGALKYGATLGLTHAVAFNPQASIEPAMVGDFEDRFTKYFEQAIHTGMSIKASDCAPRSYLCYDPNRRDDAIHAAIILSETKAMPIRMRYTGHVSIRAVSSAERVLTMLGMVSQNEDPTTALSQFLRRCRRTSADHLAFLSDAAKLSGRRALAGRLLQQAIGPGIISKSFPTLKGIASRSLALGLLDLTAEAIEMAVKVKPHDPRIVPVQQRLAAARTKVA